MAASANCGQDPQAMALCSVWVCSTGDVHSMLFMMLSSIWFFFFSVLVGFLVSPP